MKEAKIVESCKSSISNTRQNYARPGRSSQNFVVATERTSNVKCEFCKFDHSLTKCRKFSNSSYTDKFRFVKEYSLCLLCLKGGHQVKDYKEKQRCIICSGNHHKLLHRAGINQAQSERVDYGNYSGGSEDVQVHTYRTNASILLATARAKMIDVRGNLFKVRVLLDSASER